MNDKSILWNITSLIFWLVFFTLGILNVFLVHPVPGVIYILLSLIYLPPYNEYLKAKFRFSIPILLKVILAILVLWFTLAVSDLMEMFESWLG
jgi:energy-coupling factor transporter transmembrane protein EcfT